jgi:hypothetical protein
MAKLKRKKKPEPNIQELVDRVNQVSADAEGVTLKEYYKRQVVRRKSQETYAKTHWVQSLTDAQKFFIATTTDVPHSYMELPLSKGNETAVAVFKKTSKNYKAWVIKNNDYMNTQALSNSVNTKLNKAMEAMRKSTEPLRKITESIAGNYQEIGRKLRFNEQEIKRKTNFGGIMSVAKLTPQIHSGYLLNKSHKEKKIAVSNGLNTLMSKHKMKKPMEIAKHYLSTHNDPKKADYVVDSYENPIALAKGTGISHKRLFEMVCNELVKSEKLYKRIEFERDAQKVEELLNLFDSKVLEKKSVKYTQQQFFKSTERKTWSAKYVYDWKDYKRFNEDFNQWNKVFKAQAKLREESDADMFAQFLGEQARGK